MKTKTLIFLCLSFFFVSCNSLLEVDPISEITNSNYWKNESDVQGYLNGVYNDFRSLTNTTLYGEDRGDALTMGVIGGVSRSHQHELNEEYGLDWKDFYNNIHHCNMLLKYAPTIPFGDDSKKSSLLAQAYAIRAKDYLTLIQMWGDVPLVLEPTENYDKNNRLKRSEASTVMTQILSDIQTSIDLFPTDKIDDKNRVSKIAAYCIKAEALAWSYTVLKSGNKNDIEEAILALEQVENSGVSLLSNYNEIFDSEHRKNDEIIFSLYCKKDEFDKMYMSTLSMSVVGGLITDDIVNKDEIPYSNSTIARHVYAPSKELIDLYTESDKRAHVAYINAINKKNEVVFTSQNKFRGTLYTDDRYYDDDIIVYRLADVKLLKAELLCYLGGSDNIQKAINEMNEIKSRANINLYSGSLEVTAVQREILDERARELCFELKRWPDLMRAHAAGVIDIYGGIIPNLKGKSTPLYFPILRKMIDLNPNLVQTKGF